jgi:hypothetical protein
VGKLLELLPIKDVLSGVSAIIDQFHTSGEEKLEAQRKLVEIERNFNLEMAKLDQQWAATQADVIKSEAQSQSWLARNWRPLMMLFFAVIIGTVVWTGGFVNGHELDHAFVMKILDIIEYGLSGYVVGRSVEKVTPAVTQIFAKK